MIHIKPDRQHFSLTRMSSAAEAKCRKSPYDFAKYIRSVSHSPLVISYSHRCTLARTHTQRQQISGRSGLPLFATEQSQVFIVFNRCSSLGEAKQQRVTKQPHAVNTDLI